MEQIRCSVTRVVTSGESPKIFCRPEHAGALGSLDGKQYTASGEIPIVVDDPAGYEVGQSIALAVKHGSEGRVTLSLPKPKPAPAPAPTDDAA